MTPLALLVSLLGVGALLLQSGSCLLHKDRPLSVGFLDLSLALLCLYVALSLYSTRMVVAPEFGSIMVQGIGGRRLLQIALVVTAMLPALCCARIRELNQWRSHLAPTLVIGLAVGVAAASSVTPLEANSLESLHAYQYDVWWPLMILWLAACFAGSVLALLKTEMDHLWLALSAALISPLAYVALNYEDLPGPGSRGLWTALENAGFGVAVILMAMVFNDGLSAWLRRRRIVALPVAAGLLAILVWRQIPSSFPSPLRFSLELLPLGLLVVTVLLLVLVEKLEVVEKAMEKVAGWFTKNPPAGAADAQAPAAPEGQAPPRRQRRALPIKRLTGFAHALALPVIAVCITDLFSFGRLNDVVARVILFGFWMLFAERLATGELDARPQLVVEGVLQIPLFFKFLFKPLWYLVKTPVLWLGDKTKKGAAFFTDATGLTLAVRSTFLALLLMLLFTAFNEARSYQRIVIEPLNWAGEEKSKDDVSKSVSAGLINALGRMRRELRTDLTLAQRRHFGEHPGEERILQAGIDSNMTGVPIAESDDLEIAGVKIHLKLLTAPIQDLVRSALGIRMVNGTIKKGKGGDDSYVVWANSSDGESWRESTESANLTLPRNECISMQDEDGLKKEAIDRLIDKLAFDIASSEPSFIAAGMTRDWPAFQFFRQGLKHWEDHEAWQYGSDLRQAIVCFKEAIRRDARFAIAYYRLGLAMQHDGQPGSAVAAFRTSTSVNPNFVPGALAEASTLYNYNDYYSAASAALGPPPETSRGNKWAAYQIWEGMLDLPRSRMAASEWQAAYYGACLHALEFPAQPQKKLFYLPYFHCRRAANLFSHLSNGERKEPDRKALQASILNAIGVALDKHMGIARTLERGDSPTAWTCFPAGIATESGQGADNFEVWTSRTSRAALEYYRESLTLAPADPAVRCNAAAAAFLAGHPGPMESLGQEAGARVELAQDLAHRGHAAARERRATVQSVGSQDRAAALYRRAFAEYQAAIEIDATSSDVLVGPGEIFWQWKIDFLAGGTSTGPSTDLGRQAEDYARAALRLAHARKLQPAEWRAQRVLAETVLGQGRLEEATHLLDAIFDKFQDKDLDWDGLSQTQWDAAQARLCSCVGQDTAQPRPELYKALSLLDKIRTRESAREWQPFSADAELLDPVARQSACPRMVDGAAARLSYFLSTIDYGTGSTCEGIGVTGRIDGVPPTERYFLHVRGGDVDRRVPLDPKQMVPILLEARETRGDYFARVENDRGEPVSADQPFDTYAAPEGSGCTRNRITLVFSAKTPSSPAGPPQLKAQTASLPPQVCPASDPTCAQARPTSLRRSSSGRGR